MAKKAAAQNGRADLPVSQDAQQRVPITKLKPSALLDTRVVYCGDNLEQLAKLPDVCVDLIYIDPPFKSNRNYEVFWGETKEKCAFEDRHENPKAYTTVCKLVNEKIRRTLA
jgi:16S rRNA G966 N2-methylase RsmD